MIHVRHELRRERFAIRFNTAHGNATPAHAMIAARAPNEHAALRFAARLMVGEGDLEGTVYRFTAGVGKEDVTHAVRQQRHELVGEGK